MTASYEKEQKDLTASMEKWKAELESAQQQEVNLRQLLRALREFTEVKQLTPELVNIPTETEIKAAMEEIRNKHKQSTIA